VRACGANGVFTGTENDGTERLYACSLIPYGTHAFHVAIGVPRDQAYAEADRVLRRSLALFLLVTFVVMIGAWFFGSTLIVRDVQRLMAAAREMALGRLGTRVATRRTDEIGQLATAFNDMAAALETSAKNAVAREAALMQKSPIGARCRIIAVPLQQLEEKEKAKTRFLAAADTTCGQPVAAAGLFLEAPQTQRAKPAPERVD
jgi:HAMP domain-containing protein